MSGSIFASEPSMHQWVAPDGVDQEEWVRLVRLHLEAHRARDGVELRDVTWVGRHRTV